MSKEQIFQEYPWLRDAVDTTLWVMIPPDIDPDSVEVRTARVSRVSLELLLRRNKSRFVDRDEFEIEKAVHYGIIDADGKDISEPEQGTSYTIARRLTTLFTDRDQQRATYIVRTYLFRVSPERYVCKATLYKPPVGYANLWEFVKKFRPRLRAMYSEMRRRT